MISFEFTSSHIGSFVFSGQLLTSGLITLRLPFLTRCKLFVRQKCAMILLHYCSGMALLLFYQKNYNGLAITAKSVGTDCKDVSKHCVKMMEAQLDSPTNKNEPLLQ